MAAAAHRWSVLIVEDDPLIGMMLQDMLGELSCDAIGPAVSVAGALTLIKRSGRLDVAVLDCNLCGEKVWPVADELAARRIPFLFSTDNGAAGVEPRFSARPVLAKPFNVRRLAQALLPQLNEN
jgi:CheY-like chemotaxis protein